MRLMRTSLLALLLLTAFASTAQTPQAQDEPEVRSFSFLLYYVGNRVGWAQSEVRTETLDGREVLHEQESGYVEIRRSHDRQKFVTEYTVEYWYELDGRAIKTVDTTTNGGQTVKLETIYGEDAITISETIDAGKTSTTRLEKGDKNVMCDFRAWRYLKENDRTGAGETLEFWGVDAEEHALVEQTWTVNGAVKRKLEDGSIAEGVEIQIVKSGRASTLIFGEDDWPLLLDSSGFSLERVDKLPEPFTAESVTLRNAMKANVAVHDWKQLETLELHFEYEHDDGNGVPQIADSNSYHTVVKYDEGYALRLKSQKLDDDFECAYPLEEIPDDIKPYLEPTAMCQSDDEDLVEEALDIAKRKNKAKSVAWSIMRWTNRHLKNGSGSTGSASAKQAYDERKGDCTEHSVLFVALCRAAGLPARCASGMVYAVLKSGAVIGYHQWAEVWLGEWVPVDATVDELGTSARYILFEYDEPGHTHGRGRSSRCLKQNIEPVIDAYTLKGDKSWKRKGAPEFEFDQTE